MNASRHFTPAALAAAAALVAALAPLACPAARAQQPTDFSGKAKDVPLDRTGAPRDQTDPYFTALNYDGRTDLPTDSIAQEAYRLQNKQRAAAAVPPDSYDRAVRNEIVTGDAQTLYVTKDYVTQVELLLGHQVVYPKGAIIGDRRIVSVTKSSDGPYLYLQANGNYLGAKTNVIIETHENGRIQTYDLHVQVANRAPKDLVLIDLVQDRTPPIRGVKGADPNNEPDGDSALGPLVTASASAPAGPEAPPTPPTQILDPGNRKLSQDEIRAYFPTMVAMARSYGSVKAIQADTGANVYRDNNLKTADIVPGKVPRLGDPDFVSYRDPGSRTEWTLAGVWYFPRCDALVLINWQVYNPTAQPQSWDYCLLHWLIAQGTDEFLTDPAKPDEPAVLPGRSGHVWVLIQGNAIAPTACPFKPVFPRPARRSPNAAPAPAPTPGPGLP